MSTSTFTGLVTIAVNTTIASAAAQNTDRAPSQGGVFEGIKPTTYDPKAPITLFIIQASIVIGLTRLIHWPLAKINQPSVMAEVITGIILGPSIMGRIPGFTRNIFPTASMPPFSLAANIGLVLYLFLVALEVDLRLLARNWRIALSVGTLGMVLPFGLGAAIAYGLYHDFRYDEGVKEIDFSVYLLFIGIAMAITAFPVLCRILTSLNLLGTSVGIIVLSAGIGNDIVGWILLALCVALINSAAGLTALWILLACLGYCLFVTFPVRWIFLWILRRSGSLNGGPTQSVVAITVMLVLSSAFFTQIIGVHAIFGAFLIGLICPHGIFAIKLQEKIEDLVSVLLLPLYFALSGLNTNLGLLDSGIVWGYVVGICAVAFMGKIFGGTVAARVHGLAWRESLTVGCLMSCKGLVELIVLNIGLQARILSQRTFTMFVVMALVTTFATTPLVVWLYPPWYQAKIKLWREGKINWNSKKISKYDGTYAVKATEDMMRRPNEFQKLLVYVNLDSLPLIFRIINHFAGQEEFSGFQTGQNEKRPDGNKQVNDGINLPGQQPPSNAVHTKVLQGSVTVHGLCLRRLTERESSVMRVSELQALAARDPIVGAFTAFGTSKDISMACQVAIVPEHSFSDEIIAKAHDIASDFVLLPWPEAGKIGDAGLDDTGVDDSWNYVVSPSLLSQVLSKARGSLNIGVLVYLDTLFHGHHEALGTHPHELTAHISDKAPVQGRTNVPTNQATNTTSRVASSGFRRHRIIFPFIGGKDDIPAMRLVLRFACINTAEVQILDLRALNAAAIPNNVVDSAFITLKSRLSAQLGTRAHFVDILQGETLSKAMLAAIAKEASGDTLVILGRNEKAPLLLSSPNSHDGKRLGVLGTLAASFVTGMVEWPLSTLMLVVQSKEELGADTTGFGTTQNLN